MSSTEAPPTASRPRTARSAKAAKAAKAPPPTKAIEMLDALKAASRDKDIELDRLVSALEEAVATAARKVYKVREITARFDPATGGLTAWTPYRIVEQKTKPEVPATPAIDPDDLPIGYVAPPPPGSSKRTPRRKSASPGSSFSPRRFPASSRASSPGRAGRSSATPTAKPPRSRTKRPGSATRSASSARRKGWVGSPPRAPSRCSTRRCARPSATTSTTSTPRRWES
ncbi:MAG: hypothetical protein IPL90_06255 [Holophagales bacterium]|nr:hypothetical protein [Holophagales bacterium]